MILPNDTKKKAELHLSNISYIEKQMIEGSKRLTMFDLMAETDKFLNITFPVNKHPTTNTNQNLY